MVLCGLGSEILPHMGQNDNSQSSCGGPDATEKEAKGKKTMAPVLKLDDHNEEQEVEFELSWLLSLTLQERF